MRTYSFIIGKSVSFVGETVNIQDSVDRSDANAYKVENSLQIEYKVIKDSSEKANKAYVTVYNLSDEILGYLKSNQDKSIAAILTAGYDGENTQLFAGTIEFIEDVWDRHTRKTKFIFGDGKENIANAQTARSYRAGTPVSKVVQDLVSDMKLPIGRVANVEGSLGSSKAFVGNCANTLSKLCKEYGANFSVQDGASYVTVTGKRFESYVYEISEETGMIGSPTPKQPKPVKKTKKKQDPNKEDVGLTVKTQLLGGVLPQSTIYLKSRDYTGFYKVLRLEHNGSYEGGEWTTSMDLVETNGTLV
jgi:hypothetical protein